MHSHTWSSLGAVAPRDLTEARLALHYAAQPMTAAAYSLLPMREDHSHANLLWSHERNSFIGRPLPSERRCFLDVVGLRTGLLAATGEQLAVAALAGKTLDDAFAEMATALRAVGEKVPAGGLRLPEYDLPATPLAEGRPFPAPDAPALEELARWFHNGALALSRVAASQLGGAEVRGWPHHFDLAALLTLDPGEDPERARSLGVGLSPGDGSYAEPYFYLMPWPAPEARQLPDLPGGAHWHTEGFTAAVLPGSEVTTADGADAQFEKVDETLRVSADICLALLGA